MSWLCVFLLVYTSPRRIDSHSLRARVNAGFLYKDLFAERALFDGATPTSPVIRPNGPDKWVLLVVEVTGAQVPDMVRQCVWEPWDAARQHWVARSACDPTCYERHCGKSNTKNK